MVGFPWGVWVEPVMPVSRIVALASLAEDEGASHFFVADEGTERDVHVALAAVLLSTRRLVVAPAITNPFTRHPVTTAAAVATLAEMAPGRVWHGLGVGGTRTLAPLGLAPKRPVTTLAEALRSNRALLAGEAVGAARLPWAGTPVHMAVAGRGPRVQELAALEADWVILSAEPVATLPTTAARLRRHGARLAWSAYLAYDDDARRTVLGHFSYMALDAPESVRRAAGLDDERRERVRAEMLAGRLDAAAALLPDALVDQYAVAGTDEECAATIRRLTASFDLFALPLNDVDGAEAHIRRSAAILNSAGAGR